MIVFQTGIIRMLTKAPATDAWVIGSAMIADKLHLFKGILLRLTCTLKHSKISLPYLFRMHLTSITSLQTPWPPLLLTTESGDSVYVIRVTPPHTLC